MNRHILAIEDDQDALANLRDILELDGYQVTGAGTLKEATEQHSWSEYFLILLDRNLPDGRRRYDPAANSVRGSSHRGHHHHRSRRSGRNDCRACGRGPLTTYSSRSILICSALPSLV